MTNLISLHLKQVVHKKTAAVLCLTTVKNEDKMEFSRVLEAIKVAYNFIFIFVLYYLYNLAI